MASVFIFLVTHTDSVLNTVCPGHIPGEAQHLPQHPASQRVSVRRQWHHMRTQTVVHGRLEGKVIPGKWVKEVQVI